MNPLYQKTGYGTINSKKLNVEKAEKRLLFRDMFFIRKRKVMVNLLSPHPTQPWKSNVFAL